MRSTGNEESYLLDSPLDESRRPPAPGSSRSSSTRTGSCEQFSAIGLYNQARVNGQEGGQGPEIQNQSEPTRGLKGRLEAKFPENNQRRDWDWSVGPKEEAKLPYYLNIGPPSLPDP